MREKKCMKALQQQRRRLFCFPANSIEAPKETEAEETFFFFVLLFLLNFTSSHVFAHNRIPGSTQGAV